MTKQRPMQRRAFFGGNGLSDAQREAARELCRSIGDVLGRLQHEIAGLRALDHEGADPFARPVQARIDRIRSKMSRSALLVD